MFKYQLNISTVVELGSIVHTLRDFLHTQKNYSTIYEKSEAKKFRIFLYTFLRVVHPKIRNTKLVALHFEEVIYTPKLKEVLLFKSDINNTIQSKYNTLCK